LKKKAFEKRALRRIFSPEGDEIGATKSHMTCSFVKYQLK
jgi:hypothetical protein